MTPRRFSFLLFTAALVVTGWQHLSTLLLTVLFSVFILRRLHVMTPKWPAIVLFLILLAGTGWGAFHFVRAAIVALPTIAEQSIPSVMKFAEAHGIDLPFDDYQSLKADVIDAIKAQTQYLGSAAALARTASMQVVLFVAGLVVAMSIFLGGRIDLDRARGEPPAPTVFSESSAEVALRFRGFFESFETVMGAQLIISLINAILTVLFMFVVGLHHRFVIFGVAFLCGLLPIVGNLISNTVVVCVGFLVSPAMALAALVFLVAIHKLEYFLNSQIIGHRIRAPLWLTLLGLVVGEHLMGVPGMILAPVLLNYIKVEASRIPAARGGR